MQARTQAIAERSNDSFPGTWLATLAGPDRRTGRGLLARGDGSSLRLLVEGGGAEPASSVGDGTAVVFEGSLHNRSELLAQLRRPFQTGTSDAELVRLAFERWGDAAVARLKGIYAFCFWDRRSGRLIAARDRTGIYPLFYRRQGGELHLSTVASAVAATSGEGAPVDRIVIAGLIANQAPDIEETCYRGVRRLPAGNLLAFDRSGLRIERYWRLQPIGTGASWLRETELDQFQPLLDEAVGRAMGRGRAAIFLSGGLDSVSVAVAAEAHARREGLSLPLALSFFFPRDMREERVQLAVAKGLGLEQATVEFDEAAGSRGILAEALALSATLEAPLQNIWLPGYLKLARSGVERGCGTILTGRGGDEWLTMFPLAAADFIASRDARALFAHASALLRASQAGPRTALRWALWSNGARPLLRAHYQALQKRLLPGIRRRRRQQKLSRRLERRPAWLLPDPALRRALGGRAGRRLDDELREPALPAGGFRHAMICGMFENALFASSFEESYETSRKLGAMQHDIYWDPDLIEFLYRVPPHLLNQGGQTKGLIRQDIARRFPGLGFERQKKLRARNFVNEVLLEEAGAAWREMGGTRALATLGVVDSGPLDTHVRSVLSSRDTSRLGDIWLLLRLESWVRPRV